MLWNKRHYYRTSGEDMWKATLFHLITERFAIVTNCKLLFQLVKRILLVMRWYYNLESLYVRCMGVEIRDLLMKLVQKQFFARINYRGTSRSDQPRVIAVFLCHHVLYQQILRVHLISATWLKSYQADPPSISPTDSGFEIVNERYPKWHDGDITPSSIDCISSNANENDDDEIFSHEDDEDDLADVEHDDELFAGTRYI